MVAMIDYTKLDVQPGDVPYLLYDEGHAINIQYNYLVISLYQCSNLMPLLKKICNAQPYSVEH